MANLFRADKKGSGGIQVESLTVTTMPTKTSYTINDTLDLTGLVVTATFADGVTADVTSAITTSPADGDTLTTEGTIPVIVTYQGATTNFNVTCSSISWLERSTWAEIQAAAQNGTLSQFANEGDTKTITIGNYTYHMQLVSINDGTGTAGTYYPNHTADFIAVELLPNTHAMNTTGTNVGGWNDCSMRTYLNSTIYPTLPSDLINVIVEKTHMRTAGNKSTSYVSASDKLWLPTEWEMFGTSTNGGESATYNKHYSIFSSNSSRIKKRVNSTSSGTYWWESSPVTTGDAPFCTVNSSGTADIGYANTTLSVALCFRIG